MNSNKKIIILAVILSIITTYLIFNYINKSQGTVKKEEFIEIYVASKNIDANTEIIANMIKKIKVNKESYMTNSIQNINEIVGKYAKDNIYIGEVIPKGRLLNNDEKDLALRIPDGYRAMSILVNEAIAVSDLLKSGDYVDVYVTADENKEKNLPHITKLLLENKLVLAIGKELNRIKGLRVETPQRYTLTLAVTVEEGEKLTLAEDMGRLKLVLRPDKAKDKHKTDGTIRKDLVGN